jgi:hypothetical protein
MTALSQQSLHHMMDIDYAKPIWSRTTISGMSPAADAPSDRGPQKEKGRPHPELQPLLPASIQRASKARGNPPAKRCG